MEDTLGAKGQLGQPVTFKGVLILVLMEDTLGAIYKHLTLLEPLCLNPCFNGRYSRRAKTYISLFIAV